MDLSWQIKFFSSLSVRYVGALGNPSIHPVFEDFAEKTNAISLTEPGITTALEFKDGKNHDKYKWSAWRK